MTVCRHFGSDDTIHHDTSVISKNIHYFRHDLLQFTPMSPNEDGIGARFVCCHDMTTDSTEITHVDVDTWGTEASHVLLDDSLALRTNLKGIDVQMGELQASLDGDAACAETNIA